MPTCCGTRALAYAAERVLEGAGRVGRQLDSGYNHMALGLVDPYLVESWSGRRISGLPDLASQLKLFAAQVIPALAG